MKGFLCLLPALLLVSTCTSAQTVPLNEPDYNKPALFSQLPDTIKVSAALLSTICESAGYSNISTNIGNGFTIAGRVTSTAHLTYRQTAIVALTNYTGAVVSLSRISSPNAATYYKGRIFSFGSRDAYVLEGSGDNYQWIKTSLYRIVNE